MLKIEKLQPKDNAFTLEDHAEHGVATLKVANNSFTGEYHLHEVGTATVAGVGVAKKVESPIASINLNGADTANINLTLTKEVVHEYKLSAGQTTIDTHLVLVTDAATKVGGTTASDVGSVSGGVVTLDKAAADKDTIQLRMNVLVATGVAADDDVAAGQTLTLEAGETSAQDVHFDILSNLRVNPGAKPNLTHFSVRGAKLHF